MRTALTISLLAVLALLPASLAVTCPRGTFKKHSRCIPCPRGTYGASENSKSCDPCPEGTYNRFRGAVSHSQCIECPYNTFSKQRSNSCTPCPDGTFSRTRFKRCVETCPPGRALRRTLLNCAKCSPAFYRPAGAVSTRCLLCPSGTGSRSGATRCFKCPKGTFRDIQYISFKEISGCRNCKKNTFADVTGSAQCKLCPLGTVAEERGAQKCISCPAGTFRARIPQTKCKPCPDGTSSKGERPAGCKHPGKGCPVNTFEDRHGECRACMPGERLHVEEKKCVPCGDRQISLGGVATECETCPPGQRPANTNSIFEKSRCECEDGTVTDGVGCRKCPPGRFWTNRPAGTIRNTFERETYYREAMCQNCEEGFFSDKPGMTECKPCPLGTYTNIERSTQCIPCPNGFISPAGDPTDDIEQVFAERSNCMSEQTGCGVGEKRDQRGHCVGDTCPPNTVLTGGCSQCWYNEFFKPGEGCVNCPDGEANVRGTFRRCKVCPKGAARDFEGGCICSGLFGDNGKRGCKKCPEGELSTYGKCAPCGEDSFFRVTKYGPECKRCDRNTFKLREGHRRCTKCPDGFKKERNVFGEEVNGCVPRDLYPVSE